MKPVVIISGSVVLITFGMVLGSTLTSKLIIRRLSKITPLISTLVGDVLAKVSEGNMTEEEVRQYANEQLNFAKIVMKDL